MQREIEQTLKVMCVILLLPQNGLMKYFHPWSRITASIEEEVRRRLQKLNKSNMDNNTDLHLSSESQAVNKIYIINIDPQMQYL